MRKKNKQPVLNLFQRYDGVLEDSELQLKDSRRKVIDWAKENAKLAAATERMKLTGFKASMLAHDETRDRERRYVATKVKTIMKRNRMTKRVKDNYGELMALHTQLELLRLKTYPTLRMQCRFARDRAASLYKRSTKNLIE